MSEHTISHRVIEAALVIVATIHISKFKKGKLIEQANSICNYILPFNSKPKQMLMHQCPDSTDKSYPCCKSFSVISTHTCVVMICLYKWTQYLFIFNVPFYLLHPRGKHWSGTGSVISNHQHYSEK